MKHDSPKSRLKHLDFKVSDPEITTTATTTTTTTQTSTASSDSTTTLKGEHHGDAEGDDENVLLVFPENHVMGEALDKRRLKSVETNLGKGKKKFPVDNFDHGLNTLATLAQTDFDLLSTTERSGKQLDLNIIDDYNVDDAETDEYGSHNVIGFIGSNETKWVWKLREGSPDEEVEATQSNSKDGEDKNDEPHKFEQLRLDAKSTVTLPSVSPHAESDFILLSDAWFQNYSSLPEISPSAFNLTDEGLIFDTETIDLTSHSKEENDERDEESEDEDKHDYQDEDDLEKIENIKTENAGRKPKNLNEPDLVKFYPMHGKPFLSFQPEVQISNIVKTDSII
jgi:hypothetical protein